MVRIITDSAADLEPKEYEALNITCIPLVVTFGTREYQENVDLGKELFYSLLASSEENPKTSQPSPQALLDLFEEARESGEEAIYVCISSAISGTYQTACLTRDMADCDRCHVVDSRTATGGQRILVEYAARLRDQGKTAREIVAALEEARDHLELYACMDTLEYLYRGGRINQTVYKLGSLAQVKPVIHITQAGGIEVPAKAMGMRKGMDLLAKRLEAVPMEESFPLYVMYTGDRTNGEALARKLQTMGYDIPDSRIINVGAAIGSHVGPGACGLVYMGKH